MLIAADETGQFRDQSGTSFGIVTLVTVTDNEWIKFTALMNKLFPTGWSEVKCRTMSKEQREKVLKYIGSKPEIKYTSFLYDLSCGNDKWVKWHKNETIKKVEDKIEEMSDQLMTSYIKDIRLYLNQLRSYAVGDYAKYIMFTELFREWQQFFQFDYVYTHVKNDSWKMHFVIDTQNQPNKFERLVQSTLKLTTNEQNPDYGIYCPKEWLSINHPFNDYYAMSGEPGKHDAKKFYEDFKIDTEQSSPQLFLPDFIGFIIYSSILNRHDKVWLMNLKRLRQNRSLAFTNRFMNPDGYYLITGFDKSKDRKDVLPMVKEHYNLMKFL